MSRKVQNLTLGCDPEVFVKSNGTIISAEGIIGGTKEEPQKILEEEGFAIQEDNIMAEFNIPPSQGPQQFSANIQSVLDYLNMHLMMFDAEIAIQASAEIDPLFLQTDQAKLFGCDPDFNAYTRGENPAPDLSEVKNLRTCGGHIHVGYANPDMETSIEIIKAMDITLGLPSLMLDKDDRRREVYGKAGAFRFKDYGVEYRTLSNFWIKDAKSRRWAFMRTAEAIRIVEQGLLENVTPEMEKEIQKAINTNNKKLARKLLQEFKEAKYAIV